MKCNIYRLYRNIGVVLLHTGPVSFSLSFEFSISCDEPWVPGLVDLHTGRAKRSDSSGLTNHFAVPGAEKVQVQVWSGCFRNDEKHPGVTARGGRSGYSG